MTHLQRGALREMTRLQPLALAFLASVLAAYIAAAYYLHAPLGVPGPDIDQAWWAARELLHGHDPYAVDQAHRLYNTRIYYPLTAPLAVLPLAPLPLELARLIFVLGGAALFGYVIGRDRPYLWPTLFGMPFFLAMRSAQWAPLLTVAMLLPSMGWLAAVKPNLGIVMLAGARSKRAALLLVAGSLALVLVSLAVQPHWPWEWRDALATSTHFKPLLLRPGGFVVLLALFCWRDPDARMLLALAVVPVTGLFYDALPLCLVARTRKQSAVLALATHGSWLLGITFRPVHNLAEQMWVNGMVVLWAALMPALLLILAREGSPVLRWVAAQRGTAGSRP